MILFLYGCSLILTWLGQVSAIGLIAPECRGTYLVDSKPCHQPIEDVVAVRPGSFYTAKIRCYDCPYYGWDPKERSGPGKERKILSGDNDLFFNVTLSHDDRSVLLNGKTFFPKLSTFPKPPDVVVPQLRPEFSYQNLSYALGCREPSCRADASRGLGSPGCLHWCGEFQLGTVTIDYLYITKSTHNSGNSTVVGAQYWEFDIDAIGGYAGYGRQWAFDNASQKMLKVVIEGTELQKKGQELGQATPFSPFGGAEKTYNYRIADVQLVDREFKFPVPKALSVWERISKFFGNVWEAEGRLVYMQDEWDDYGKQGTLRYLFNDIINWHSWDLVGIIVGSVFAGLLVIYGVYRFIIWILQQRELMKWDGMDDVWDKLRREREEEENALLHGRYRDDPEEGGSSPGPATYTDDLDTMKPLPTKPLPEKPLPEVPLIDA